MSEKLKKFKNKKMLYKYIFLTLNHIEKRNNITQKEVFEKIINFYKIKKIIIDYIIISKELHQESGYHYHIIIVNKGFKSKRKNLRKDIRNIFPEFDGRSIDISFKTGINNTIKYITKEDKNPFLYNITLDEINEIKKNVHNKQKNILKTEQWYKDLIQKDNWNDVLIDESFGPLLLNLFHLNILHIDSQDFKSYSPGIYDIILMDEFNYNKYDRSFLLKLLEGSPLQVTGKYSETKLKYENLPVILILNPSELLLWNDKTDPFYKRVQIVNYLESPELKLCEDSILLEFFIVYNQEEDLNEKLFNINIKSIIYNDNRTIVNNIFVNSLKKK